MGERNDSFTSADNVTIEFPAGRDQRFPLTSLTLTHTVPTFYSHLTHNVPTLYDHFTHT
jgi:hypothetical protein